MTAAATAVATIIRRAVAEDLGALQALYAAFDPPGFQLPPRERVLAVWGRIITTPRYAVWVAEEDERAVGTYSMLIMDSLAHDLRPAAIVENVAVSAECRGRGIGATMMRHAMARAAEAGCYKLALSTNKRRIDAHRFYRRLGFADHGISLSIDPGMPR